MDVKRKTYDLNDENIRRHVNKCRKNEGKQPLIMNFLHKLPRRDGTKESSSSNNLDENENEFV